MMKAVRLHQYGGPEKLQYEDSVPDPSLQPDSILIRTVAASINPIDWKVRSGARQKDFPLQFPAILGRDVSGVVSEVGATVTNIKPGDPVVAFSNATYAEFVAVAASSVTHVPDGLELADSAAVPLIALTGDQLVRHAAGVQSGQTVVVTGALGSVGRAAVHTAKKMGARVIAGVRKNQLSDARSLGVADVVALDDNAAIDKLAVDAIADTVGGEVGAKLLAKVKAGGRFGYASGLPENAAANYPQIKVTRVFAQPDPSKVREFLDDIRDGRFVLPIGRRLPLKDAAEGHRLGEKGGIGKILLIV
jgi:NADPH:quinone reductase-like Zn-dependent oxidoreductase